MRIEISLFHDIEDSLFIKLFGAWEQSMLVKALEHIQSTKPVYLVVDPTHGILSQQNLQTIEDTNPERRQIIEGIASLMQANPRMLYIMINRNNNPYLKTPLTFFEESGVVDRYLFPKDDAEALDIIRTHQAQDKT